MNVNVQDHDSEWGKKVDDFARKYAPFTIIHFSAIGFAAVVFLIVLTGLLKSNHLWMLLPMGWLICGVIEAFLTGRDPHKYQGGAIKMDIKLEEWPWIGIFAPIVLAVEIFNMALYRDFHLRKII